MEHAHVDKISYSELFYKDTDRKRCYEGMRIQQTTKGTFP